MLGIVIGVGAVLAPVGLDRGAAEVQSKIAYRARTFSLSAQAA